MSAFAGPTGTGKTLLAKAVAGSKTVILEGARHPAYLDTVDEIWHGLKHYLD